jgi:hypothetical protein
MSADSLQADLGARGLTCAVEDQGKLAVLMMSRPITLDARMRRAIVTAARAHGFANVCVELSTVDAPLSGDQSAS